jgi:DNA-binding IclR family transcriptional regulator
MSGLFSTPDTGPQREQMRKQEEQLRRQEMELSRERTDLAERAMASAKARRGGGVRALLSAERPDELGVQPTKLGGGS